MAMVEDVLSQREVAKRFDLSEQTIRRHKAHVLANVGSVLVHKVEVEEYHHGTDLLGKVAEIEAEARAVLAAAKLKEKPQLALHALDRLQKNLTLLTQAIAAVGVPEEVIVRWQD